MSALLDQWVLDLDAFIDPVSGFAVAFTKADLTTVYGVFLDGTGTDVEDARAPMAVFKAADIADLAHGDELTHTDSAITYTIEGYTPQGKGLAVVQFTQL